MNRSDTAINIFPDSVFIESESAPFVASEVVISTPIMLCIQRMPVTPVAFDREVSCWNSEVTGVPRKRKLFTKRYSSFLKRGFHRFLDLAIGHADPRSTAGARAGLLVSFARAPKIDFATNWADQFDGAKLSFVAAIGRAKLLLFNCWNKDFSADPTFAGGWFSTTVTVGSIPSQAHFFTMDFVAAGPRTIDLFASRSCNEIRSAYWTRVISWFAGCFAMPISLAFARANHRIAFAIFPRFYKEFFAATFADFSDQGVDPVFAAF